MTEPLCPKGGQPDDTWLIIGQVVGVRGVHGQLKIRPESTDWLTMLKTARLRRFDKTMAILIEEAAWHPPQVWLQVVQLTNPEDAALWRGAWLEAQADQLPPPKEDEYRVSDLIKREVWSVASQQLVGRVADVLHNGDHVFLSIERTDDQGGQTICIPFQDHFFPTIEVDRLWLDYSL